MTQPATEKELAMVDILVPQGTEVEITTPRKHGGPRVERTHVIEDVYIDDATYVPGDDTVPGAWEYSIGMSTKSTVRAREADVRVVGGCSHVVVRFPPRHTQSDVQA